MKTPFGMHYGKNRKTLEWAQTDLQGEIEKHMNGADNAFLFATSVIRNGVITVANADFWVEKCGYRETNFDLSFFDATAGQSRIRDDSGSRRRNPDLRRPYDHP